MGPSMWTQAVAVRPSKTAHAATRPRMGRCYAGADAGTTYAGTGPALVMSSRAVAVRKGQVETNPSILEKAMVRRLPRRSGGSGQVIWPAVPSLIDQYTRHLGAIFAALGRTFSEAELATVKT